MKNQKAASNTYEKSKENAKNQFVILRGYGNYYGHNIKAKVIKNDKENGGVIVETSNGTRILFDNRVGWNVNGDKFAYSGYQLDLTMLNKQEESYNKYLEALS